MSGQTEIQIAEGTSSFCPDGNAAPAGGKSGPAFPPPAPGHDISPIDPAVSPGGGPKDGGADVQLRSRPDYLAVYLSVETAVLAAIGAAERNETPGSFISRAVVEFIQQNGGISKMARILERIEAPDRASGIVARPAGAPAAEGGDAAREAEQPGGIARV